VVDGATRGGLERRRRHGCVRRRKRRGGKREGAARAGLADDEWERKDGALPGLIIMPNKK
jgi:hypothetical protein